MVDGQVGFHRPDNVRRMEVEKNGPIVRQIEKTKETKFPDLYKLQQDRMKEIQREQKQQHKELMKQKEKERQEAIKRKEELSYDRIFTEDNMTSNTAKEATVDSTAAEEFEDDFF